MFPIFTSENFLQAFPETRSYEEIPPQAEVGNDLYDSDSDLDELDIEDTVESIFNSDAELQFDDESFVGERENFEENEDQPLYPEASISLGTFMLLFTSFTMKHSLSSDGILQLLNIFSYVLPKGHTLCTVYMTTRNSSQI